MVHVFYILHFRCMNRDVKNKQFKIFKKSVLYPSMTKKRKFDVCHDCNGLLCTSYN